MLARKYSSSFKLVEDYTYDYSHTAVPTTNPTSRMGAENTGALHLNNSGVEQMPLDVHRRCGGLLMASE